MLFINNNLLKISTIFLLIASMLLFTQCHKREWINELDPNRDPLKIGDYFAGGIVFYLDGKGGGLVCAESDQSTYAEWGFTGTAIGGTGTGLGTGISNTAKIVAGSSDSGIAARICNDLVLNGYSDWFLPSKDELNLMYQNLKKKGIGGFADDYYWSSSEYSSTSAWTKGYNLGYQGNFIKDSNLHVRAVRAF